MRLRLVTLALPLLVSVALVATAIPASAGRTDAEERFCETYQEGVSTPSADDPGSSGGQVDFYRELAKVAPKKSLKKNLKVIVKYFDKLADIDPDDQDAITDMFTSTTYTKYVKAAGKVTNYIATTCSFTIE